MENDLIKQYLLGELSSAEQVALEDEYFLDRAKYDQLCKAEDELIDKYVRGSLSATDNQRFEQCYLKNPRRRRHVKFARALSQVIDEELAGGAAAGRMTKRRHPARPDPETSWWSQLGDLFQRRRFALGMALAVVIIIALGEMWMMMETSRLRERIIEGQRESEVQQQRSRTQAEQIAALESQGRNLTEERNRLQSRVQTAQENASIASRLAATPVFLALSVSAFRSPGSQQPPELIIPPGVEAVRLRLELSEYQFASYRVTLLTAEGREVWRREGLKPRSGKSGDFCIVNFPAGKFADGDNVIALSAIGATGEVENLGKAIVHIRRP